MKFISLFFISLLFIVHSEAQQNSFVKLRNNKLYDRNDQPLFLKGVNLGCWLLWEEWMWGGGFNSETKMKNRLKELMSNEDYNTFLRNYYSTYITEKDIQLLSEKGVNSIRVPFNYRLFGAGEIDGFTIIDSLVKWCSNNNIYIILDMHAAPGGQSALFIADPSGKQLWQSDENKDLAIEIWKKIAQRYKNEATIAGYDLLNEPQAKKTEDLISLYKRLASEIRKIDQHHLLIIEGNQLAHDFKNFPSAIDSNQVYSFHYYAWFGENKKKKDIENIIKYIPGNSPVWCGEWGEDEPLNLEEVNRILKAQLKICGISFWSYKKVYKNNHRMPLCNVLPNKNWDKVIHWLTWRIFKPKPDEVQKGVAEFLNAIKLENCQFNIQVKNAIL